MTYTYLVLHPDRFFLAIRHDPPVGSALLLLLVLACLWGVVEGLTRRCVRGYRSGADSGKEWHHYGGPVLTLFFGPGVLAFLDFCLLIVIRGGAKYEWLYCLVAYSSAPIWFVCIPSAVLETRWLTLKIARALSILSAAWASALFLIAVRSDPGLVWWHYLLLAAPFLGTVWAVTVASLRERPEAIRACLPWRRSSGKRVILFYPVNKSGPLIPEIVSSLDSVLDRVTGTLGVSPLTFRVPVFLFSSPDELSLHVAAKGKDSDRLGQSHGNAICVAHAEGHSLESTAAHEFAHVLRYQRISPKLFGLLDEGLACYVENSLHEVWPVNTTLPVSWRTMARYTVFYEWLYTKNSEYKPSMVYSYACSVATFLVGKYGIERYLDLCRKATGGEEHLAGDKLAQAVEAVYKVSVTELEAEWRGSNGLPDPNPASQKVQLDLVRRMGELESIVQKLQHQVARQQALPFDTDADSGGI